MTDFKEKQRERYLEMRRQLGEHFSDFEIRSYHVKALVRIIQELHPHDKALQDEVFYHLSQHQLNNQPQEELSTPQS